MTEVPSSAHRLMLIDGHALIHRAFHAINTGLSTSDGEPTNAVFGFSSMLLKAIDTLRPTHIVMAMDRPVPTFRHESYAAYKATRPPTPRPLVPQFLRARQVAEAMNISIYEVDGFEADDVLGTLALQADTVGIPTTIVTGDLDALQLVSENVHVLTSRRGIGDTILYDVEAVERRYGLEPSQLPDYKGLVGDTSDNIPGVPGIGDKSASELLAQFRSLETLFERLPEVKERWRKLLEENREQAFESRRLARIVRDVPITLDMTACAFRDVNRTHLLELFHELEFESLRSRVLDLVPGPSRPTLPPAEHGAQQLSMFEEELPSPSTPGSRLSQGSSGGGGQNPPPATATATATEETVASAESQPRFPVRVVWSSDDLDVLLRELRSSPFFAVDTETTSTDPLSARLVGFSFAVPGSTRAMSDSKAWYLPVGHDDGNQLPLNRVLEMLRPVLADATIGKVGHNLKYDYTVLAQHDVPLRGLEFDTMIAAYLLSPNGRNLSLSAVALKYLQIAMTPIEDLIGKGKHQITMAQVGIDRVAEYAGADAGVTLQLRPMLEERLRKDDLDDLFRDMEMPLVTVLAEMEQRGVAIDTGVLRVMSREMAETIGGLEERIFQLAGCSFNINSTQQLGQILFQQMELPHGRRTKTGFSTDSEVLEALRGRHEIIDLLLEYRGLVKLKNTYVDALPSLISEIDGRIHTDFNQTVTATGRLSSSAPNLQNIPIRGEEGRKIRKAFVASESGNVLLAADYSQIELRILASMSGDARLLETFRSGEDVHRATAAAVFGTPLSEVTADQRRIAKVVNFGIIYGIGEVRLAQETGISRTEAAEFIANYNRTYSGVKSFMDGLRLQAAHDGYVFTLLKRRRPIPEIHSDQPGIRQAAERAAINMPIQGTNADIIKLAMIRLDKELKEHFSGAYMVLQVHDELVFDLHESDLEAVASLVKETMEHAFELKVPIEVEMKAGRNWYEMAPVGGPIT